MKITRIQSWLRRNLPTLKYELCLDHWDIIIKYSTSKQLFAQVTSILPEYERATMYLFWNQIDNEQDLEDTIRHELIHLVLSPFNKAENMLIKSVKDRHRRKVLQEYCEVMEELVVRKIETILKRSKQ